MTLSIRNPKTERLARELSERTGKSITAVVDEALSDYAMRTPPTTLEERHKRMEQLFEEWNRLPIRDARSAKEIIDDLYDENGLPK